MTMASRTAQTAAARNSNWGSVIHGGQKLGELLVAEGRISEGQLRDALNEKYQSGALLGEVLRSNGLIDDDSLAKALATQWNLGRITFTHRPPDPDLLLGVDTKRAIHRCCLPWRRINGVPVIAVADPSYASEAQDICGLTGEEVGIAVASQTEIISQIEATFGPELADAALETCPEGMSARTWSAKRAMIWATAVLTLVVACLATVPAVVFWVTLAWVLGANIATALFRIIVVLARIWPEKTRADEVAGVTRLGDHREQPRVTLMIGLLHEELVLPSLLKHLADIDYPRERLDIMFLLENGDEITQNALGRIDPERAFDVVVVPEGTLKTKPRALNYGLNFCKGDIVGILDAEDRPAPDQISEVVRILQTAPPDVACVQGVLDFYNPRRNWLSRCFTIEYAIWFRVLLKGIKRLGLPIPLGGTTVYFRRDVLESIGAWDAHNVTEDADLGMRLARFGYKTETMAATTDEEANARLVPWIRQRSRWIKGYVMTWAIHMRRPSALIRDLGLRGFLAFQIIFLGGVSSYLSIPFLWAFWLGAFDGAMATSFAGSDLMWRIAFTSMLTGQIVMVLVAAAALVGRDKRHLLPWIVTLPLYWPIGAIAALKAVVEVFFAPFYWDKTTHGDQSDQTTVSETAPSRPMVNS